MSSLSDNVGAHLEHAFEPLRGHEATADTLLDGAPHPNGTEVVEVEVSYMPSWTRIIGCRNYIMQCECWVTGGAWLGVPYTSGSSDCTASLTARTSRHRTGLLARSLLGLGSREAGGVRSSIGTESCGGMTQESWARIERWSDSGSHVVRGDVDVCWCSASTMFSGAADGSAFSPATSSTKESHERGRRISTWCHRKGFAALYHG